MKKKYARLVDVPEIEKDAYDHDRFISGLVMHQLIHLSTAEQCLPEKHRTGINISTLHSEREAADYIGRVTRKLHELKGKPRKKARKPPVGKPAVTKKSSVRAGKKRIRRTRG